MFPYESEEQVMSTFDQSNDTAHPTLDEMHNQLLQDGERWRDQVPGAPEEIVHRVRDALYHRLSAIQDNDMVNNANKEAAVTKGSSQMTQENTQVSAAPNKTFRLFKHKGRIAVGTAAVLIVTLVAIFVTGIFKQPKAATLLAPPSFYWSAANVNSNLSPQQAFERGVTLTPCKGQPAQSNEVSWIGVNPHFGLALIQSRCSQDSYILVFVMSQNNDGVWMPKYLSDRGRPESISARNAAPVPAWLPLPKNVNYLEDGTFAENTVIPVLLRGWYTSIKSYHGGRIIERVMPASQGETVVVAGKQGQLTQDDNLTTVLVPLSDGETYFFTATATPQETVILATALLTHIDQLGSI